MQEPTDPRPSDDPQLSALTDAVRSIVRRSPEAKRVAEALADWLRAICDAASCTSSTATPSTGALTTDAGADAQLVDTGRLAEHNRVDDSGPEVDAATHEEALRTLRERWSTPDVSPKIAVAGPPRALKPVPTPLPQSLDLSSVKHRLSEHLHALDWAISCARLGFEDTKVEFHRLLDRGKASNIFFWEAHQAVRDFPIEQLLDLKGRYEAVDAALGLYLEEPAEEFGTTGVFRVLGSAVGGLHSAMEALRRLNLRDSDLERLVRYCASHPRHGPSLPNPESVEVAFDPSRFNERIASIRAGIRAEIARKAAPRNALRKLAYHLRQCRQDPLDADSHLPPILAAINAFVDAGRSLTAPELLGVINENGGLTSLPESLRQDPLGERLIATLQNPGGHLNEQEDDDSEEPVEPLPGRIPTAEVLAVRDALQGKRVVIIGGDERPSRKAAIRAAFDLGEVDWIATRPHETHDALIPPIRNPETAVVLLLIRWSSHSYGDLCDVCERFGKPLVRLPGGYNPSMIAREVSEQAGRRLGVRRAS